MNLLETLWKPATSIKPEELIGKQIRLIETKEPLIIEQLGPHSSLCVKHERQEELRYFEVNHYQIEYLDDSKEAVEDLRKLFINDFIPEVVRMFLHPPFKLNDEGAGIACKQLEIVKEHYFKLKEQDNHKQQDNG